MNAAAGASLVTLTGLGIPAIIFLWRAIPLRRERPELLRNGLWFMLPFLVWPVTWYFSLIIAPTALVVAVVTLYLPAEKKKGPLFYAATGELTASILGMGMLAIVNTFFVH